MQNPLKVNPFGSFDDKALCGFFEQTIASGLPSTNMFGLHIDFTAPNATLKDEDGNLWNVTRFHNQNQTAFFTMGSTRDGRKMYEQVPEAKRAYKGMVMTSVEGDSHSTTAIALDPAMEGFRYNRRDDGMEWDEGSLLSLKGTPAAPALYWYLPTETGGLMYTSFLSRVEGTILGRKCEGFHEYAMHWCVPGHNWVADYFGRGIAWLIVCNEYTDGTRDLCHLGFGMSNFHFALVADENGPRIASGDLGLKIELDEGRYPKSLDWNVAGEHWHWEGKPSGDMGDPARGIERGREGIAQRVGDTRQVKLAYGWVFFLADGRIDPYVTNK